MKLCKGRACGECSYCRAKAEAQRKANETGRDFGVERHAFGFSCFALPRPEFRSGHELRCEVVSPEVRVCE